MFPQIGYLVFTFCQTSSFVICRQCAQTFSVAFGEEATVEIHQCKQLGNALVHQVPRGREGGAWWEVRRLRRNLEKGWTNPEGTDLKKRGREKSKETNLESNPSWVDVSHAYYHCAIWLLRKASRALRAKLKQTVSQYLIKEVRLALLAITLLSILKEIKIGGIFFTNSQWKKGREKGIPLEISKLQSGSSPRNSECQPKWEHLLKH